VGFLKVLLSLMIVGVILADVYILEVVLERAHHIDEQQVRPLLTLDIHYNPASSLGHSSLRTLLFGSASVALPVNSVLTIPAGCEDDSRFW
jgi:hypothetical protein